MPRTAAALVKRVWKNVSHRAKRTQVKIVTGRRPSKFEKALIYLLSLTSTLTRRRRRRCSLAGQQMSAHDELSDIELVDQLVRGVPGAFEVFFQRYERLIYHCIRKRADVVDVEDLVQSFFERLVGGNYRILKLWQRGTSLTIYLSAVVRNFVFDFHRKKHSQQKLTGALSESLIDASEVEQERTAPAGPKMPARFPGKIIDRKQCDDGDVPIQKIPVGVSGLPPAQAEAWRKRTAIPEWSSHSPEPTSPDPSSDTLASQEITPAIELRELRKLGIRAWAELDERDRSIVCGQLHRDLSNETMAQRLKLTGGALRTALSRAHVRLLQGLKTLAPEYFPA